MEENRKPQFDKVQAPETETLEKYLLEEFKPMLHVQKRLSILLACIGEKPGETVKFLDEERSQRFEKFLEETEVKYLETGSEYHSTYFFSMKKQFLGLLESSESELTPESIARFRGLPKTRIENPQKAETVQNTENEVEIESENRHLQALSGIDPVDVEEKKQALEQGERRAEILRQYDRRNNTNLAEKLLEELSDRY